MPWKDKSVTLQRLALVRALLRKKDLAGVICRRFGVSRQTGFKFQRRFVAQGLLGLKDCSRRPRCSLNAQATIWCRRLLGMRRCYPTWGSRKLRWLLRKRFASEKASLPAERTLQRWIARAGLNRLRPTPRRRIKLSGGMRPTIARRSNDVWTFDLKGWFRTMDGSKVEPLTVRDLCSRFVLCTRPVAPRDERTIRGISQRLFRRHGPPRVIRCDQGAPFFGDGPHGLSRLSLWWWRLGIRVEFVRRGSIDNNGHEQMHGVLKAETSIARTVRAQAQRLERWRARYNRRRPHEALGMQTPASCYRSQSVVLPRLQRPTYPPSWLVRVVQRNGEITLPRWRGSIGRAFGGLPVGLAPTGKHRYRVYFASLYLGELDLAGARKLRIELLK